MIIIVKQILLLVAILFLPHAALASEYSVRPFLIDTTVEPRDIVTEKVLLTNNYPLRTLVIFATVNEITVDTKGEIKDLISPVMSDRTNTVTSWIEVQRSRIEVPAGEEREVPITFRINPNAQPGEYHAFIGFVPAANRPIADNIAKAGEADGVVVKITVADQRENNMRISKFSVNRFMAREEDQLIDIEVHNLGDIPSIPTGELIFYNSRGEEVSALPVNTEQVLVGPGETKTITAFVPDDLGTIGRFKANVTLRYSESQNASLYDSATFLLIPWHLLVLLLAGIVFVSLAATLLFKRVFIDDNFEEDVSEVTMFVRDGHDAKPKDHDINLRNPE